jgi:hypothetical protein
MEWSIGRITSPDSTIWAHAYVGPMEARGCYLAMRAGYAPIIGSLLHPASLCPLDCPLLSAFCGERSSLPSEARAYPGPSQAAWMCHDDRSGKARSLRSIVISVDFIDALGTHAL